MNNSQLKVDKIQTSVKKGYKLGSSSATWKKLKQVTSDPKINRDVMVESGPLGEVFIIHLDRQTLEVWYWLDPDSSRGKDSEYYSGDTLYFYFLCDISCNNTPITSVQYVGGDLESGYQFLVLYQDLELDLIKVQPGVLKASLLQVLELPDYFTRVNDKGSESDVMKISIKTSKNLIVVANSRGLMYVFKLVKGTYKPANCNNALSSLKKSASLPILRDLKLLDKVSDNSILFKTSCTNGTPIFDLKNNWLVYSPCKVESNQIKISGTGLTPVKLPSSKRLLNNVLESLSNNALDSLFKLSKYSNQKINDYLNNDQSVDFKTIKNSLNKLLNQTINTISDSIDAMSDNQIIKIVDLENDKVLCVFKSPDGISHVSFNPYDLQLVSCTLRGDNFFIWDLTKLTSEISLMGKFVRGKTSGVINEIFWFINNNESDKSASPILKGSNSGFGCISKSGTIHWYNINYLLSNLNNNYPTFIGKEFPAHSSSMLNLSDFLDSWLLGSSHFEKFVKIPNLSHLSPSNLRCLDQLAVIDGNKNLKLLSPLNGLNSVTFELPTTPTSHKSRLNDTLITKRSVVMPVRSPLSQFEIETCKPFINLINFNNIQISNYDFSGNELDAIVQHYEDLNADEIPYKTQKKPSTLSEEDCVDLSNLQIVD